MHARDRIGRLAPARSCPVCPWQIVSDSHTLADLEQATHRVDAHATLPERRQIQHLITDYRQILGDLPTRLLVLAVAQVLDTPAPAEVVSAA